jgi:hypothetical protein
VTPTRSLSGLEILRRKSEKGKKNLDPLFYMKFSFGRFRSVINHITDS